MASLDKLSDDCLLEVLEKLPVKELFKIQRVNHRLKRVAGYKMKCKIKMFSLVNTGFKDCTHLGKTSRDQQLNLSFPEQKGNKEIVNIFPILHESSCQIILNVLARASGIKRINFSCINLPDGFLLKVVQAGKKLECIHLATSDVNEDEWNQVMELMGERLVHFTRDNYFKIDAHSEIRMIEKLAAKCTNIKRVDWYQSVHMSLYQNWSMTSDFLAAFKALPKSCYVTLCGYKLAGPIGDVFNELNLLKLDWSLLSDRYDRLVSLQFESSSGGQIRGVEFNALKKLRFIYSTRQHDTSINFMIASRFPRLEKFFFNASLIFTENNYSALFEQMPSVKKLTINWTIRPVFMEKPNFPRSSIHKLEQLEVIKFGVQNTEWSGWEPKEFIELLEQYVDEVESLKKLNVQVSSVHNKQNKKTIEDEVNRIKLKQNRVEVVFK